MKELKQLIEVLILDFGFTEEEATKVAKELIEE